MPFEPPVLVPLPPVSPPPPAASFFFFRAAARRAAAFSLRASLRISACRLASAAA